MNAGAGGIFVNSGELSGDLYAASLVRSLRSKGYEGRLFGMGGSRSAAAGLEVVRDSSELHLVGVGEVIHAIPRLISACSCPLTVRFVFRPKKSWE